MSSKGKDRAGPVRIASSPQQRALMDVLGEWKHFGTKSGTPNAPSEEWLTRLRVTRVSDFRPLPRPLLIKIRTTISRPLV